MINRRKITIARKQSTSLACDLNTEVKKYRKASTPNFHSNVFIAREMKKKRPMRSLNKSVSTLLISTLAYCKEIID